MFPAYLFWLQAIAEACKRPLLPWAGWGQRPGLLHGFRSHTLQGFEGAV